MKRLMLLTFAIAALLSAPQAFSQKILTTIQIGGITGYPAVNTTTNMIYVPNTTTGALAVINGQTNQIVTNIPVGVSLYAQAVVNPNTNLIYVGVGNAGQSIAVIDGSSNVVIATIPIGGEAMVVNPAANLIYSLSGNGNLSVLDGATNQVIKTIEIAKVCCPQSIAYSGVTNRLYVTMTPRQLIVVDANTYEFTTLEFPQIIDLNQVAVDSTSNRVYLNDAGGSGLWVINGYTGKVISTIVPGDGGPIAVNPINHLIGDFGYSLQARSEFLAFVSGHSYAPVGNPVTFPVAKDAYTMVSGVNNRYYVTFYQQDGIAVVSGP
jgi:DNA-binding beta-propeller fold protein YncE